MREYVKIFCCGDCIHYDLRKHRCGLGAHEEGKPTDNFYRDCPIGIHKEDGAVGQEGGLMEELKRCPFCGGEARYFYFVYTDGGVCIRCLKCGCQTEAMCDMTIAQCREHNSVEAIPMKWNRRVDNGSESETR